MECIKKRVCMCAGVRYRSRSNVVVAASAAAAADDDDVADVFLCVCALRSRQCGLSTCNV